MMKHAWLQTDGLTSRQRTALARIAEENGCDVDTIIARAVELFLRSRNPTLTMEERKR